MTRPPSQWQNPRGVRERQCGVVAAVFERKPVYQPLPDLGVHVDRRRVIRVRIGNLGLEQVLIDRGHGTGRNLFLGLPFWHG